MSSIQPISRDELVNRLKHEAPARGPWVFDCDGTLIRGDIASLTAWGLIRFGLAHPEQLPNEWDEFKKLPFDYQAFRKLRQLIIDQRGINAVYEWEALLHTGLPPSHSFHIAQEVVEECLRNGEMAFSEPLSSLATHFRDRTWIVSGSPTVCVQGVGEYLKVPHERVIGTVIDTVDGVQVARIREPGVIWEDLKRVRLVEEGVLEPWLVAGDTIGDWQMMQISTRYVWACLWGVHRHRGEEMRERIQKEIIGPNGPQLPETPGFYTFDTGRQTWIFEVKNGLL